MAASARPDEGFAALDFNTEALLQARMGRSVHQIPASDDGMNVIGLAGWSGAGKTTLLTKVIPHLVGEGLRVSTIKHAHHDFDIDVPGKDSWRHREAGATEVLVASGRRWALMHELRDAPEPRLVDLLRKLSSVDLVIVEGFRSGSHPRVEIYREGNGQPLMFPSDMGIVGIVSDTAVETSLPHAHLDDIPAVARLLQASAVSISTLAGLEIPGEAK